MGMLKENAKSIKESKEELDPNFLMIAKLTKTKTSIVSEENYQKKLKDIQKYINEVKNSCKEKQTILTEYNEKLI